MYQKIGGSPNFKTEITIFMAYLTALNSLQKVNANRKPHRPKSKDLLLISYTNTLPSIFLQVLQMNIISLLNFRIIIFEILINQPS